MNAVRVVRGAKVGQSAVYGEAAARLGAEIAGRGPRPVYGGGRVGLMGILADAALPRWVPPAKS